MEYKVLVVDDEDFVLRMIQRMLLSLNHEVYSTNSGYEAVNMALNQNFDAVICDFYIPDLGGEEVVKQLTQLQPRPYIICISSGTFRLSLDSRQDHAINLVLTKALEMGADAVLHKPIMEKDLKNVLNSMNYVT